MHPKKFWLIVSSISVIGAGCASNKEKVFDQNQPTMRETYNRMFVDNEAEKARMRKLSATEVPEYSSYTRDIREEIHAEFPELPNPEMVMYVYPHLTNSGVPVPGYYTTLRMYLKTQYALPGEEKGWDP